MEKSKLVTDFLNSLSVVLCRIKKNDQWYELRVAQGAYDKPFVDKEGTLFGVKNAKINFYIFKEGANETADWATGDLKEMYTRYELAQLPEDKVEITWGVPYSIGFTQFLLAVGDFQIFTPNGEKVKKWDPTVVH